MKIRLATLDDLPEIEYVIRESGLGTSRDAIRKYFWESPCIYDSAIRGGVVVEDEERGIVGFSGLSPCEVMIQGKSQLAYQMGVLGFLPGYGSEMFLLMDKVVELTRTTLVYANTANEKSSKLWSVYADFQPGPVICSFYQYKWLLGGFLTFLFPFVTTSSFEKKLENIFQHVNWQKHVIVTSRTLSRLRWLYGASTKGRKYIVLPVYKNKCAIGYVVLWPKQIFKTPFYRYEIMDIFAIEDSPTQYKTLLNTAQWYASLHGGVMIEYTGARNLFSRRRKLKSNTFIWRTEDEALKRMLSQYPESFFGPYDGDRGI